MRTEARNGGLMYILYSLPMTSAKQSGIGPPPPTYEKKDLSLFEWQNRERKEGQSMQIVTS